MICTCITMRKINDRDDRDNYFNKLKNIGNNPNFEQVQELKSIEYFYGQQIVHSLCGKPINDQNERKDLNLFAVVNIYDNETTPLIIFSTKREAQNYSLYLQQLYFNINPYLGANPHPCLRYLIG